MLKMAKLIMVGKGRFNLTPSPDNEEANRPIITTKTRINLQGQH